MKIRLLQIFMPYASRVIVACLSLFAMVATAAIGADFKTMPGHVPKLPAGLTPKGRLPGTNKLSLAIGLQLRDSEGLDRFLKDLYNPASPQYRKYLTPQEFTARFSPTESDYAALKEFARTNGFIITTTHSNRLLLDVSAPASAVERAFRVSLRAYRHPTENRDFYAPDVEPMVETRLRINNLEGLSDFYRPRSLSHLSSPGSSGAASPLNGSGSGGIYYKDDFRTAYVPGTTLTGAGQIVGLLSFGAFNTNDIRSYANGNSRKHIIIEPVLLDGADGEPSADYSDDDSETTLDIEMSMAMAPGLEKIVVFEAPNNIGHLSDILNAMASRPEIKNLSSSFGYTTGRPDLYDNIFKQMAAQGQSFFQATGDSDAFTASRTFSSAQSPHITQVGGTTLTMNGQGDSYNSERVWNDRTPNTIEGGDWGSSGGISTYYPIPDWQQGVNMASNGGSTSMRNIPDVALTADNCGVHYRGTFVPFKGVSCAAPLWAGFTALANEQAAANGQPSVGFLNPALYRIAQGPAYSACFNDITNGDNTFSESPNLFYAVPGYDLCTGLGTPKGNALINALLVYNAAVWVDYSYTGNDQNGSYDAPFKTLAQAVNQVAVGGSIFFKTAGSKRETMNISRPMNINANGGPATVGQ